MIFWSDVFTKLESLNHSISSSNGHTGIRKIDKTTSFTY